MGGSDWANIVVAALLRENEDAKAEIRSLKADLEDYQAMEMTRGQGELLLIKAKEDLAAVYNSSSWRITAPVRALKYFMRPPSIYLRAVRRIIKKALDSTFDTKQRSNTSYDLRMAYRARVERPAAAILQRRAIIVAEMSIPQCTKYRVRQKQHEFNLLGIPCDVFDWGETEKIQNALQLCSIAIWYRVPGYPASIALMEEANRLNVPTIWEVDDLNFDAEIYAGNQNVDLLDPDLKRLVLSGVPLYRKALLACKFGLASTRTIADEMERAGVGRAFVIENAVDDDTREFAEEARTLRDASLQMCDDVWIIYGSGSKAHDADFKCAHDGLLRLMHARQHVHLLLIGDLAISPDLANFGRRLQRAPFSDYKTYLSVLATAHITIAPLQGNIFNDGKSNIKFLEAAMVSLPCVCSPRAAFLEIVEPGTNGLVAETPDQWFEALLHLVDSPDTRSRMGKAAFDSVSDRYSVSRIAQTQLIPALNYIAPQQPRAAFRILLVNVFFNPQRFGGATIVCEEIAREWSSHDRNEVFVFTSLADTDAAPYSVRRYSVGKVTVFAVKFPSFDSRELEFNHPQMEVVFNQVLESIQPDAVHFHAMQGLGANLSAACLAKDTPYVITLHDAWWICERQFMVTGEGRFCNQSKLDWNVCATCVANFGFSLERANFLRDVLDKAALLLAPSDYQRNLYIDNGVKPQKIRVNKNGIRNPTTRFRHERQGPLRFAYVGGLGAVKGSHLVKAAFEILENSEFELVVVDNTLNVGHSTFDMSAWGKLGSKLHLVPAYTQDTIDDFFSNIDVLLFPSQCKESFGLVVREALIRDVWVISTDSGGAVEDIVEGENGNVIPLDDNPKFLRDAILALTTNSASFRSFSNPHKAQIKLFPAQALEIENCLHEIVEAKSLLK